jgi:hypothetical protein
MFFHSERGKIQKTSGTFSNFLSKFPQVPQGKIHVSLLETNNFQIENTELPD